MSNSKPPKCTFHFSAGNGSPPPKYGSYTYEDGSLYIGEWNEKGQKHGMGHYVLPNKTRYDGAFENGLFNGLGVISFPDGARYEGEFMQGWFHGHGVFWRNDTMRFEGEFRGGRIWGYDFYEIFCYRFDEYFGYDLKEQCRCGAHSIVSFKDDENVGKGKDLFKDYSGASSRF
ncbi:MORN repeat-containing protein 4 [Armadillidium vulgare]|nr:MORN repeat-containing protein 4 [Armadillidium vulgare]